MAAPRVRITGREVRGNLGSCSVGWLSLSPRARGHANRSPRRHQARRGAVLRRSRLPSHFLGSRDSGCKRAPGDSSAPGWTADVQRCCARSAAFASPAQGHGLPAHRTCPTTHAAPVLKMPDAYFARVASGASRRAAAPCRRWQSSARPKFAADARRSRSDC